MFAFVIGQVIPTPSRHLGQPEEITVEILPTKNVIYKISGDLGFENWNFAIVVKGVRSSTDIGCLKLRHYAEKEQILFEEYAGQALNGFLKKADGPEIILHNFHVMLPAVLKVDSLTIEILSKSGHSGLKSVKLMRYNQRNEYRLPVSGTWFVSSGHDFGLEHRRHLSRGHFAWDFVRVDGKGQMANGDELEDNFSFGQPVFAPAAGVVVDLHSRGSDNKPETEAGNNKANYIEIDHGNEEISRAVHLKDGSIQIAVGDRVVSGQKIAEVGNSGRSDNPHLHFSFHREAVDALGNMKQIPLPVQFSHYRVSWNQGTNVYVRNGRPRRGQFIQAD